MIRLIGADGAQVGVLPLEEARQAAEQEALDLVEISPNVDPPVCRLMDYGKYLFSQNKKRQAARRKRRQFQIKEIKFRPNTGVADYQIKLRNLLRFLGHGDKVKVTVRFKGREMVHPELGQQMLQRVVVDVEDSGMVEQVAKFEGRQMIMVIAPRSQGRGPTTGVEASG